MPSTVPVFDWLVEAEAIVYFSKKCKTNYQKLSQVASGIAVW